MWQHYIYKKKTLLCQASLYVSLDALRGAGGLWIAPDAGCSLQQCGDALDLLLGNDVQLATIQEDLEHMKCGAEWNGESGILWSSKHKISSTKRSTVHLPLLATIPKVQARKSSLLYINFSSPRALCYPTAQSPRNRVQNALRHQHSACASQGQG